MTIKIRWNWYSRNAVFIGVGAGRRGAEGTGEMGGGGGGGVQRERRGEGTEGGANK